MGALDEVVDIVDERGRILRQASKFEAHEKGWLHKAVIGYLRHGHEWTMSRQAPDRQDPGQLVPPVGGHVQAGETDLAALRRESKEEIGVRDITHKFIGRARFHRQVIGRDENHLFIVYEIDTADELKFNHEAVSLETLTDDRLKQALQATPDDFGGALYFVFEHFYTEFLPANYQRRWTKT